jgi:hypothetical protein
MRAEKVIFALLTADAGVLALLGASPNTRIYPSRLPQNTVMPAIAYQLISGMEMTPINAQGGQQIVRSRVQVTALAKNYTELKNVLEAVRLACLYKSGVIASVRVLSVLRDSVGPDTHDDDLSLYMQSIDFMVTHYET